MDTLQRLFDFAVVNGYYDCDCDRDDWVMIAEAYEEGYDESLHNVGCYSRRYASDKALIELHS